MDVVLLGATGFTGRLTADRLATYGPDGLRWAVAGRDQSKLEAVRERLAGLGASGARVQLIRADVTDPASLRSLAEQTSVVATTVGPFMQHGEPVVAACAETGTDYADLCGEPEFVDRMWLAHHKRATTTGARLVHACGFDSVPHDLGVWFTVKQLPAQVPLTVTGYVSADADFSGGTYHSAVRAMSRARQSAAVSHQRRRSEREPPGRRRLPPIPRRLTTAAGGPGYALPLPTIDPVVVRRSARAVAAYGPDFGYEHYAVVSSLATAVGTSLAAGGMLAVAQVPWGRDLLLRLRAPGSGPSVERRARSSFRVRFVGSGGGHRVTTEVRGGDPGYDETATMLAESALCLALDDLPGTAGQVTTVEAMGDPLLQRLQTAGVTFEVLDSGPLVSPR